MTWSPRTNSTWNFNVIASLLCHVCFSSILLSLHPSIWMTILPSSHPAYLNFYICPLHPYVRQSIHLDRPYQSIPCLIYTGAEFSISVRALITAGWGSDGKGSFSRDSSADITRKERVRDDIPSDEVRVISADKVWTNMYINFGPCCFFYMSLNYSISRHFQSETRFPIPCVLPGGGLWGMRGEGSEGGRRKGERVERKEGCKKYTLVFLCICKTLSHFRNIRFTLCFSLIKL